MEILHYGKNQIAVGKPDENIKGLRWVVCQGEKVLQQQRFGIPSDFKYPEGDSVIQFYYYWEDVPTVE